MASDKQCGRSITRKLPSAAVTWELVDSIVLKESEFGDKVNQERLTRLGHAKMT